MVKVTFLFSKSGVMKYISHLELMRLLMRACRRARLPLYITKGFHPHVKLSIQRALKLGVDSEGEEATVWLTKRMSPFFFKRRLNVSLPHGVRIRKVIGEN